MARKALDRWSETTVETFCDVNVVSEEERAMMADVLELDLHERLGAVTLLQALDIARCLTGPQVPWYTGLAVPKPDKETR